MHRKIDKVEASVTFWKDLERVRKESWYPQLRRCIAEFVTEAARGETSREKGFSNPKLKGIMHIRLPKGMRMFHVYPENDRLRLCLVIDHAAYGFNGKHTGREGRTADKIWRDFEVPVVHSPFWDDIKWRKPSDILCNPEVQEMSAQGLADLLSEIEDETFSLQRLKRHVGVKEVKDIPEDAYDAWAVDLIEAQDRVTAAIEEMARNRQPQLKVDNFEPWLGM